MTHILLLSLLLGGPSVALKIIASVCIKISGSCSYFVRMLEPIHQTFSNGQGPCPRLRNPEPNNQLVPEPKTQHPEAVNHHFPGRPMHPTVTSPSVGRWSLTSGSFRLQIPSGPSASHDVCLNVTLTNFTRFAA